MVKAIQKRLGDRLCFAFRNFPLVNSRPHAQHAAEAAEAAGAQGRFWEMHDILYENQDAFEDEDLAEYASIIGLKCLYGQNPNKQMTQRKETAIPRASKKLVLKAVIICDDFAFAESATATLRRVGHQTGVNVHWMIKRWQVNALNDDKSARGALAEALDAHLILFQAWCAQSAPLRVLDWLRHWAPHRIIKQAALAVIHHASTQEITHHAFPELRRFVEEYGLSFIADNGYAAGNNAKVSVHFHQVPLPVSRSNSTALAPPTSYRAFGINE